MEMSSKKVLGGIATVLAVLLLAAYFVNTTYTATKVREIYDMQKEYQKEIVDNFSQLSEHIDEAQQKLLEGQDTLLNESRTHYDFTIQKIGEAETQAKQALNNAIDNILQTITGETAQTQELIRNSFEDVRTQFEMGQNESRKIMTECFGEVVEKIGTVTTEVKESISHVKIRVCSFCLVCCN